MHRFVGLRINRLAPILLAALLLSTGCAGTRESIGAAMAYRGANLPDNQIISDLSYREDAKADLEKHRLDLFLPAGTAGEFATLVFVHGGGWTHGDRNTGFGGIQPYQNIGRYWANQGIAVAVLSYRLQPAVDWHAQIDDVADATRWVRENIAEYGGRPDALYLSGHSAGAWLAARLAFDAAAQRRAHIEPSDVCGTILVSGAAFDLRDPVTFELGASPAYFEERFGDAEPDWKTRASIVPLLRSANSAATSVPAATSPKQNPPTQIFWAEGEAPTFERQGTLLANALEAAGQQVETLRIPGLDHQRIAISMSRSETPLTRSIRSFLEETECPAKPIAREESSS